MTDQLRVEELETQCLLLAKSFGELEDEEYKEAIHDVETFIYNSQDGFIFIAVEYDHDRKYFDVYISSTHDDINYDARVWEETLSKTYECCRTHYNHLTKLLQYTKELDKF